MFKSCALKRAALVIYILIANHAYSQTNLLKLDKCIEQARATTPSLQAKKAAYEAALAAVKDARHQQLPTLKLHDQIDIGSDNSLPESYFPMGITPSTSGGIKDANNLSPAVGNIGVVYLEHELLNFGLSKARTTSANSYADKANADLNREDYLISFTVSTLYFEILKSSFIADINKRNIDRYNQLRTNILANTRSGLRAGVDSSVANAEIAKAKIEYLNSLSRLNILKSDFAEYTGIAANQLNIDTGVATIDTLGIAQIIAGLTNDTVNDFHPLINYYRNDYLYNRQLENLVKKSYLPKVYLLGSFWGRGSSINTAGAYLPLYDGFQYTRYNYMAGLGITYNILDLVHRKDKLNIQTNLTKAAEARLQEEELDVKTELDNAGIEVQSAYAKLQEIPGEVKAAHEAYNQKLAQYNAGLVNVVDLTNAAYILYQAETSDAETHIEMLNALLLKAAYSNQLTPFIKALTK